MTCLLKPSGVPKLIKSQGASQSFYGRDICVGTNSGLVVGEIAARSLPPNFLSFSNRVGIVPRLAKILVSLTAFATFKLSRHRVNLEPRQSYG